MSDRIIGGQNHGAQLDHRGMEVPGGINSAADKGVSAMILSYHDSVPPTFADKQVNAHGAPGLHRPQNRFLVGRVPSPSWPVWCHNENCCRKRFPYVREIPTLSTGCPAG